MRLLVELPEVPVIDSKLRTPKFARPSQSLSAPSQISTPPFETAPSLSSQSVVANSPSPSASVAGEVISLCT